MILDTAHMLKMYMVHAFGLPYSNPLKNNHAQSPHISYGPIIGKKPFSVPCKGPWNSRFPRAIGNPRLPQQQGPDARTRHQPGGQVPKPKPWGEPNPKMEVLVSPTCIDSCENLGKSRIPNRIQNSPAIKKHALKEYSMLNDTTYHWTCTSQPFPRCSLINHWGLCSRRSFRNKMASLRRCLSSHGWLHSVL